MNEVTSPTSAAPVDPLLDGRDALARHAWPEAFELLSQADREGQLSGPDLENLAVAAFFAARADLELDIKERAFKVYVADGNDIRAAYVALDLAHHQYFEGKHLRSLLAGALISDTIVPCMNDRCKGRPPAVFSSRFSGAYRTATRMQPRSSTGRPSVASLAWRSDRRSEAWPSSPVTSTGTVPSRC